MLFAAEDVVSRRANPASWNCNLQRRPTALPGGTSCTIAMQRRAGRPAARARAGALQREQEHETLRRADAQVGSAHALLARLLFACPVPARLDGLTELSRWMRLYTEAAERWLCQLLYSSILRCFELEARADPVHDTCSFAPLRWQRSTSDPCLTTVVRQRPTGGGHLRARKVMMTSDASNALP